MIREFSFTLCTLSLIFLNHSGLCANLLAGDTDGFPGEFEIQISRGQQTVTGRIPPPWAAGYEENRGEARLRFGPDPLRQRPSFGLINLSGPKALVLTTRPAVTVEPGTEYELSFELLSHNSAIGTLRLSGATRRIVPLRDTRGVWLRQREIFTAESAELNMEFSNSGDGAEQGIYLSRLRLVPAGTPPPPDPRTRVGSARLPGFYGQLQEEFARIGPMSFLNGPEPDVVTRLSGGGDLQEVENMPFRVFRRHLIRQPGSTPQSDMLRIQNRDPVLAGETVMLVFYARGEKSPQSLDDGEGPVIQGVLRGPIDLPVNEPVRWQWNDPGRQQFPREAWTRFEVPARWAAPRDMQPGELSFEIWMGHKAQRIDIGGLALITFQNADRDALPRPVFRYRGDEAEAAWRQDAQDRIRQHRTGVIRFKVEDGEGNPLPGASVSLEMQRHAFHFGTAIDFLTWHGRTRLARPFNENDLLQYRTRSMSYFNRVVVDDVFRWQVWESARSVEGFKPLLDELLRYYHTRGVSVGAGPLWMPGSQNLPQPAPGNVAGALLASIRERVLIADSLVRDWSVVRETAGNREQLKELGPEILLSALREVNTSDGDARLWIEEVDIRHAILNGAFLDHNIPANHGWPGWLKDQKAPLFGLSAHAAGGLLRDFSPEQWWRIFDAFQSRFQLPLRFTRLHIPLQDPEDPVQQHVQLQHFRDSLLTLFAHPAVEGVDFSGFWASAHSVPASAFWDADWNTTPLGEQYLDLVYREWWSRESGVADENGIVSLPAFHGTHQIILRHGGLERRSLLNFESESREVTLRP